MRARAAFACRHPTGADLSSQMMLTSGRKSLWWKNSVGSWNNEFSPNSPHPYGNISILLELRQGSGSSETMRL
jgi:hypothetical protein